MRKRVAVITAVVLLLGAAWVDACCMVPRDYEGDVDQTAQQVAILHHDGHQELIVRVAPEFLGTEELPGFMAWVLTVPAKPTGYALANRGVFNSARTLEDKLQDLAEWQEARRSKFSMPESFMGVDSEAKLAVDGIAASGLAISEPIRVGPYDITEVKARGSEALDELNAYLQKRGFPQEDPAHMRWFVENDFTFLCIYIEPQQGKDKLGQKVDLEPLQVGFDTPRPYYPGMFSSQQGNFALKLAALTSKPIQRDSLRAIKRKLVARTGTYDNLWTEKPLPDELGKAASKIAHFASVKRWYVNRLVSRGFNRPGESDVKIANWKEDVRFTLGTAADDPPAWYYGDRDIGSLELFWREHRYAGMVLIGGFLLAAFAFLRLLRRGRRAAAV